MIRKAILSVFCAAVWAMSGHAQVGPSGGGGGGGTTNINTIIGNSGGGTYYVDAAPYSAAGNGTSDDQGPINAALSACSAGGGGTVVLGPHRYLIDTVGLTVPSRCTMYCPAPLASDGNFSTLKYSVILNSDVTVTMATYSQWEGCSILQKGMVQSASWAGFPSMTQRQMLTLLSTFAGTGMTWRFRDVSVRNTLIAGFALGINAGNSSARVRLDHVNIDSTACLIVDNSHDISRLSHVECFPFVTIWGTQSTSFPISGIANNGSGLYQITLTSPSAVPITGDTVWIDQNVVGPQSVQARHFTATVIDTTHIDLQSSAGTGSVSPTGNVANLSTVITNLSSTVNIGVGETITGTGIPGGTVVTWISPNGSDLGISQAATATNSGVTLTITDTAYVSGGNLILDSTYRTGIGMEATHSEGIENNDLFVFGHQTGFHLGTGMAWFGCVNCWNDGPIATELTATSVLVDSTAKGTHWMGGRLNNQAVYVGSSGIDANIFSSVIMDSNAKNWNPIIETDSGVSIFNANSTLNGAPFILVKDATTRATFVGNNLGSGQFALETNTGTTKLEALANNISATTFAGILNWRNYQLTVGGTAANCGGNVGAACSTQFGGQESDIGFQQNTMSNGGTLVVSGNSHSLLLHATGVIPGFTITMPSISQVGQELVMYFDQVVTALTMGGTSSVGMPGNIAANTWYRCSGNPAKTQWQCGGMTAGSGMTVAGGSFQVGSLASSTTSDGEQAMAKITASGTAPGAGFLKFEAVTGTNAGTCKIIAYAGTSTTPVTIVDNVGGSC